MAKATNTTDFDFANVAVEDAEVPATTRTREKAPNPFLPVMESSWEARNEAGFGTGKQVTIPAAAVKKAESLIRRAADDMGVGSRIVKSEPDKRGMVTVTFQARQRRAYHPRKPRDNADTSETTE